MPARYVSPAERPKKPEGDCQYSDVLMHEWAIAEAAYLEARQPTMDAIQRQRQRGKEREGRS